MILLILLFPHFHYGRTQQLFPTAVPLAVRSPYLSCWGRLGFGDGYGIVPTTFASGDRGSDWDPSLENFALVVLVRVDSNTTTFLGDGRYDPASPQVNLTTAVFSPTQTVLIAEAGPMQINLTFLNPIEPEDWVKQSIPLSYMSLTAKSLDGAAHSVQVYSDLSAEWVSGNRSQEILWTGIGDDSVIGHQVRRQNPTLSDPVSTDTEWGTLHHFMQMGDRITWKVDKDSVSRHSFLSNGGLDDAGIATYLPPPQYIIPNSTVFAMSRDLGIIQATHEPVIWVIGYTTDPVINYTDLSGASQRRSSVYKTQYSDDRILIFDFMNDFANASSRAQRLDQKILQDAAPISGQLGDLVSFATALVYGSTQLTVATGASGGFNKSDVMAFMKNIGGPQTNRVNPVETLYSAFPVFMSIDPELGGFFLEPLFRLQASPKYTNRYAAADLETSYPDVSVSNSSHGQGVEDSGDMLIMTCAHARASGDGNLISRYYGLLTSWADYLSDSTLLIYDQYSGDGLLANNQTNLAIKGIIAIKAMSQMSSFVNKTTDFEKYSNTSSRLYTQWKNLALARDKHLFAAYGRVDSWTLGYNLFADVWLNTSIIESSVYDGQSSFIYNSLAPAFGMPLPVDNISTDSNTGLVPIRQGVTLSWNMFVAAITRNQDLRTKLISAIYREWFSQLMSHDTFIWLKPDTAQGAMYAPLALKVPAKLTPNPTTAGTPSKPHTSVAAGGTIRGVLGGVAALLVILVIALVVWRRRRQSHRRTSIGPSSLGEAVSQDMQTDAQQRLAHDPFPLEDSPLPLGGTVSVPVGLSSKELARLRRSLENGLRSQPVDGRPSDPSLTATADRGALEAAAAEATSSSEAQILRSEVNVLRHEVMHEIQRLHTEISEPPPSYASGAA